MSQSKTQPKTQQTTKYDSSRFVKKGPTLVNTLEKTPIRSGIRQRIRTGAVSSLAIVALHGLLPLPARGDCLPAQLAGPKLDNPPWVELADDSATHVSQRSTVAVESTFAGQYRAMSPDRQSIVTYSQAAGRSHRYRLDGTEIASYEGEFQRFMPDASGLITYARGRSRLYRLDGTEQAVFTGAPVSFTPDLQGLLVVDDLVGNFRAVGGQFSLRLYDFNGTEKASFEGTFANFTPDGQGLVIIRTGETGLVSTLYGLDGIEKTTLSGRFISFTPDGQGMITTEQDRSSLYRLDGSLQASLRGRFPEAVPSGLRTGILDIVRSSGFTPDGEGIVTTERDRTWLYDRGGAFQRSFPGSFWNFTPDGQSLITYTPGKQSWLYRLDGTLQRTFKGQLLGTTPDGQRLLVESARQSQLYPLEGPPQVTFEGSFVAYTPDGQGLVTSGSGADGYASRLYSLVGGEPIVLEGILLGFVAEGRGLVTCGGGIYGPYRLYRRNGQLQAVSQTWPSATPGGQGIVVTVNNQSRIYPLNGEAETFTGTFRAFSPDPQRIITYSAADGQTRLYRLDTAP